MDTDDCDHTTVTNHTTVFKTPTPTNNTIFPRNPTPYFENFTFTQGNSSTPCVPLKPNDFIELEKLKIIPTPTTIPTPITISSNNSVYDTNQNSTFYNFPTLMEQQQMQLNLNQYELDLTEQTKLSYYDEPRFEFPSVESPIFNFEHASNRVNCITITTDHFDLAYNHPSLQLQPQQELNQLPIQEPQTNSMVLANANPQPNKQRSRKRKNQPLKMICEMNAQKLLEDPWAWRKYGQKPIKGSPYPSCKLPQLLITPPFLKLPPPPIPLFSLKIPHLFTFTQGNSSTPCVPLKPNDFIELEKLKIIPTPTTIPTPITITSNNSVYDTNQNSTFYNFPTLMEQQQMQLNLNQYELDLTEQTKLSYYDEPRFEFPSVESPIFNFEHASNRVNCITITTDHFDLAYNHPSLQLQPQQELNQLPIQEPQTNSMVLANANPQPNKQRSRKRKNQPLKMICEMNAQKLLEDPWAWRKYGQKPIKGSPYPRWNMSCALVDREQVVNSSTFNDMENLECVVLPPGISNVATPLEATIIKISPLDLNDADITLQM
uniref:Uncharacterized protein LOC105851598 n=1 Tax=Cicer arietinum TaxID=3827 RepID=A0A1S3DXT8_CICAR|nr:uncharacterized protein LOC105851598 [Cicer arietinum]